MANYYSYFDDSAAGQNTRDQIDEESAIFGMGVSQDINCGIITATSFEGSGANLTGVSGFSTALSSSGPGQQIFKTNEALTIGAGTSYKVESDSASGYIAFTRSANLHMGTGSTFVVGTGTTLVFDVLNVFS